MNDITPILLIFALTNKNGFKNIKNAFEAADGFTNKISNLSSMMNMLPMLTGLMNKQSQTPAPINENYVDTLKDVISSISK